MSAQWPRPRDAADIGAAAGPPNPLALPGSQANCSWQDTGLRSYWNSFTVTWPHLQRARQDVVVFDLLLGIRWM